MNRQGQNILLPSLAVAGSAVFWGTTWIPLREIDGPGVPAEWSGLLIYLVPALLVLPMILIRRHRVIAGGLPLLIAAIAVGACNGLFAVSMVFGEIGIIILLFYLNPIWATVLERIVIGTPIARARQPRFLQSAGRHCRGAMMARITVTRPFGNRRRHPAALQEYHQIDRSGIQ